MNKQIETPEIADKQSTLPYTHCLNCGTELQGKYCHNCGQEAVNKTPTIGSFIFEYIDHAFKWDHQFFSTFWTLIRRPGHLTNEFNAGKFVSQEHPLKLNMFLLLIFVLMFTFFSSEDKLNEQAHGWVKDQRVFSSLQLQMLADDPEYVKKMEESPRDTILLQAPLFLTTDFPQILNNIETKEEMEDESLDKWVAVLPHVLVEDEILVMGDNGYYYFNAESEFQSNDADMFLSIWEETTGLVSHYFPILLLLTVPFLSFSIRLVQRKRKVPGISHFVFALHYTAFLETLMIVFFVLHLTLDPSMKLMEYIMLICTCIYLSIAYRRVYADTWVKAFVKSLMTSAIYFAILLSMIIVLIIVACCIVAINVA